MARKPRIFLSYAISERDLIAPLVEALQGTGYQILDPHRELYPQDNPCLKIGRALESANAMVAFLSEGFALSDICQEEVSFALSSEKYASRIVSVRIRDDAPYQPWILANLPAIEYASNPDFLASQLDAALADQLA